MSTTAVTGSRQDGTMARHLGVVLAVVRIGSGLLGLLTPRLLHRLSGLEEDDSPSASAYTRYFATRALGLGIGYVLANDDTRQELDRIGLLVDGGDTLFAAAMYARGSLPAGAAAWLICLTGVAALIDLANLTTSRGDR